VFGAGRKNLFLREGESKKTEDRFIGSRADSSAGGSKKNFRGKKNELFLSSQRRGHSGKGWEEGGLRAGQKI